MVNWNTPTESDSYLDILDWVRERDEHVAKMSFTGDSNIPTNVVRYDSAANKFQSHAGSDVWNNLGFHSAIDSHIANTALHEAFKTGDVKMTAYPTASSGWLVCNGVAVSRSTYATLFGVIGTSFGAGDGSTTFNLPNFSLRLPIGVGGTIALGGTAGAWDHTHTGPSHQHTIDAHKHTMGNHTHGVPAHQHPIAGHEHTVAGHGHALSHANATCSVADSGSHTHGVYAKEGGSNGSAANRAQGASSTTGTNVTYTSASDTHSHAHSAMIGTVGNWNGGAVGKSGDSDIATTGSTLTTTQNSTLVQTSGISTNDTDTTSLTTNAAGTGTTSSANPPVLGLYFFIKT